MKWIGQHIYDLVARFRNDVYITGNVGIGTDSPSAKLHTVGSGLFSSSSYIDLSVDQTDSGKISMGVTSNSADGFINVKNTGAGHVATDPSIKFLINSSEKMRITSAGNVGIGTGSPKNKLDIVGSLGRGAPVTKTTDFTVAATENWLIMNGTATITITLPTAADWTGRELMIKNIAAYTVISDSSNVKPIDTNAAATAILPATAGSWCTLVSDGTNWVTMMN
jgi:hypothetical protein